MKILHVSQGLPPFRVGGLTRYCTDLMAEQKRQGHEVALLYPGRFSVGKTRIISKQENGIALYELINPLPLALVFGISSPSRYIRKCNSNCFKTFLKENSFDVIHVHCTMGIYLEFFQEAKQKNIPIVYTTHDYYLLCPKCNLVTNKMELCEEPSAEKCKLCNQGYGLSKRMEWIMQSHIYQKMKYTSFFKKVRTVAKREMYKNTDRNIIETETIANFNLLLEYNLKVLNCMTIIHANSFVAQDVYKKFVPNLDYRVLTITHSNLPHYRKREPHDNCQIGYIGGTNPIKGYSVLKKALEKLDRDGYKRWELHLYGGDYEKNPDSRIHCHGIFEEKDCEKIYSKLDVVVVPSICKETFGYTILEALCAGTQVIASDLLGASMLVSSEMIYDGRDISGKQLASILKKFLVRKTEHAISKTNLLQTMEEHAQKLENIVYRGIRKYEI